MPLPNGRHTLTARAQDESGRWTVFAGPLAILVNNPGNQLPLGVVESPRPNERLRGTVRVSGYAYDPDGTVRSVTLLVNGLTLAAVPYGRPRPDACAQLPEAGACPNIGFEMDLDTRLLGNGLHALGIRVTDESGGSVVIPRLILNGMNVFVEN